MAEQRKIKSLTILYADGEVKVVKLDIPRIKHAAHWIHDMVETLPATKPPQKQHKVVHEIRWIEFD